jgi:hypothetical protein
VAGTCGYGEGLSGSINAGNFLTSCKVYWLASQEGDFFRGIRQFHVPSKTEYQDISGGKDGRCVMVTTLPPACAECLEILEP